MAVTYSEVCPIDIHTAPSICPSMLVVTSQPFQFHGHFAGSCVAPLYTSQILASQLHCGLSSTATAALHSLDRPDESLHPLLVSCLFASSTLCVQCCCLDFQQQPTRIQAGLMPNCNDILCLHAMPPVSTI